MSDEQPDNNGDQNSKEKQKASNNWKGEVGDSSTHTDSPVKKTSLNDDPLGIKSVGSGVLVLLVICGFLFIFSKFGSIGTKILSDAVDSALGEEGAELVVSESETIQTGSEVAVKDSAPKSKNKKTLVANESLEPKALSEVSAEMSKSDLARNQLLQRLKETDRFENVEIEIPYIAFSKNEETMAFEIRYIEGKSAKKEEFHFIQDEFGRYVSKPDSGLNEEIKIWMKQK